MQLGVLRSFVKHKVGRSIQEYLKKTDTVSNSQQRLCTRKSV